MNIRWLLTMCFVCLLPLLALPQSATRTPTPRSGSDAYGTAVGYGTRTRPTPTPRAGAAKPTPTPASGAGKTADTKFARTKPIPKPGASQPGAGKSGSTSVVFSFNADVSGMTLYFDPPDLAATQGREFASKLHIANPKYETIDHITIVVRYDPFILEPMGINDRKVKPFLLEPSTKKVFEEKGIIVYDAKLAAPQLFLDDVLLTIKWQAKEPTELTTLEFVQFRDFSTALSRKDKNLLGDARINSSGLVPGSVTVAMNLADAAMLDQLSPQEEQTLLYLEKAQVGGVNLALKTDSQAVRVGQEFDVHVVFENPLGSRVDNVALMINFDPQVLQVVDYDDDNWISRGVNIFDGAYHENFPFDYHIANSAYNESGKIVYRTGLSSEVKTLTSGIMAAIRFKAVSSAPITRIRFTASETARPGARETRITYLGENVLGEENKSVAESLHGAALSVVK